MKFGKLVADNINTTRLCYTDCGMLICLNLNDMLLCSEFILILAWLLQYQRYFRVIQVVILLLREVSVLRLTKANYFAIRQKHDLAISAKSHLLVPEMVLKRPGLFCLIKDSMLGHELRKSP